MEKKRLEIKFSHPNTLNVLKILVPFDHITSVLSMGEVGVDVGIHNVSNHDLLELIRASKAELAERGFVNRTASDVTVLREINQANAASGLPPVAMS